MREGGGELLVPDEDGLTEPVEVALNLNVHVHQYGGTVRLSIGCLDPAIELRLTLPHHEARRLGQSLQGAADEAERLQTPDSSLPTPPEVKPS